MSVKRHFDRGKEADTSRQARIYQDAVAHHGDDSAEKRGNPMRMKVTVLFHTDMMGVSTGHVGERKCDDPVRPAHFDGVLSISVAK